MAWRVWGKQFESGELEDQTISQPIVINQDTVLIGCRIWIIIYDNPVFTSLNMKIYDGADLIAQSSNSPTKSEIITLGNGIKEIFFTFNKVNLKASEEYNFVLNGIGYAPSGGSHISWRLSFPDPVYQHNSTITFVSIPSNPLTLTLVGSNEL